MPPGWMSQQSLFLLKSWRIPAEPLAIQPYWSMKKQFLVSVKEPASVATGQINFVENEGQASKTMTHPLSRVRLCRLLWKGRAHI